MLDFNELGLDQLALGELQLVAAYVLVAVLLLGIGLWAKVRWWIKAGAVIVTFAFFFVTFVSVKDLLGWPSDDPLPDRFELLWVVVDEPNQSTGSEGAIYFWLMKLPGEGPLDEMDVYTPGRIDTRWKTDQLPRAYKIPYSRALHRDSEEAKLKVVNGSRQIGVSTRRPKKPGEYQEQSEFAFYDRPDPVLPPKDPPPDGG